MNMKNPGFFVSHHIDEMERVNGRLGKNMFHVDTSSILAAVF